MKNIKLNKILVAAGIFAVASYSSVAFAQSAAQQAVIACEGYQAPKTKLLGERAGKKLQGAYDVYLNEELDEKARVQEAIELLRDIDAKEPFDKSTVERFLGQLLVSEDGKQKEAYQLLKSSADRKVLNDKDQADMYKLLGDLSLQEENYADAIDWYQKWMDFTCKEEASVWVKVANAHINLEQYDKVITAADKAIPLYEEPKDTPYRLKLGAYHETKQYKKALEVAETLVELFPEEKNFWSQLGFLYMLNENYEMALATFAAAETQGFLSKKNEYKALIQLYAQNDVPYKSAQLHKKYMNEGLLEDSADDLAALANTLIAAREHKEAAKYYALASDKDPDPEYFRKRGVMLMKIEDFKGAIPALEKSLENGGDSGKINYSLMEANFYAGNYRQAYIHAKEAMKDDTLRRSIRAWLPYIQQKADNRGIKI